MVGGRGQRFNQKVKDVDNYIPPNIISRNLVRWFSWAIPWNSLGRGKFFNYLAKCSDYWAVKRGRKAWAKILAEHNQHMSTLDNHLDYLEKLLDQHQKEKK